MTQPPSAQVRHGWRHQRWLGWALLLVLAIWGSSLATQLHRHARQPADAVLVLGGSIRREIVVADAVAQGNSLPVLISHGAKPPCTRLVFERVAAPIDQVWLETCAESTFDNYRYSLPTLKQWGVQHVVVVTSPTHLPRAEWLARILLSSHGIWVEMQLVEEIGIPANVEAPLKTMLDVGRSLAWAIISQVYRPACDSVFPLSSVDLAEWTARGFQCEHQADIQIPDTDSN
ncbi:YdcF family protein [Leptolyngbya iicbica]|uniref:YdcF family protein n=2 Tax=Cyanophyceae TaxID=3028117 RepID=A0A4Q7EFC7_9CYAN|nr:YdcF family protein [Leptolyngbya sp. LK]RZM81932.1 YdcF family protein [Leptolyngbya sp. LK]